MSNRAHRAARALAISGAAFALSFVGVAAAQAPRASQATDLELPPPPAKPAAGTGADAAVAPPDASAAADLVDVPTPPPPEPPPTASAARPEPAPSVPEGAPPVSSTPAPAPSAAARDAAEVRLGDTPIFPVRVGFRNQSPRTRAMAASAALTAALKTQKPEDVRVEERADAVMIFAGPSPIIELSAEDATAAGEANVKDYAARVTAKIREAMRREQNRSAIATTVFSLSLVVLAALLAIYLLRKVAEFAERAQSYLIAHPERVPRLRIYSLEVVHPAALRSALLVSFGAGRFAAQLSVIYFWLLGSLSLFDATRPYTEKLTAMVVSPITNLLGRLVGTVPLVVVTLLAAVVLLVVLRFIGMFFDAVARGETRVAWLPTELAAPTSLLLRLGLVAAALAFGAPVVTGDSEGAMSRTGGVLLAALGLGATPLLATLLVGAAFSYSKRYREGDLIRVAGHLGRVTKLGMLEVSLRAEDGAELRIPHLASLLKPSETLTSGRVSVDITVAADQRAAATRELLATAAGSFGRDLECQLVHADADGLVFRVSVTADAEDAPARLLTLLVDALVEHGVPLGRGRALGGA